MKTALFALAFLAIGIFISGVIYSMIIIMNNIKQTEANTAAITQIVEFINKSLETQKQATK